MFQSRMFPLNAQTVSQWLTAYLEMLRYQTHVVGAVCFQDRKREHVKTLEGLCAQGFIRDEYDGEVLRFNRSTNV